ncbi:unnamed protein product, partial [Didymodactylos carnosus]
DKQYSTITPRLEFETYALAHGLFQHAPYGTKLVDVKQISGNLKRHLVHSILKVDAIYYKEQANDSLNEQHTQAIFVENFLLPRTSLQKHAKENIIDILQGLLDRIINENGQLLSILSFSDTHIQDIIDQVEQFTTGKNSSTLKRNVFAHSA